MMTNRDISTKLKISETVVSRLLSGKRNVSRPLAEKLSIIFPCKNYNFWRSAGPEELKRAFEQLKETKETA